MIDSKSLANPLFFNTNRVWRCYLGGKLLDEYNGKAENSDGHFPEDWLCSTVRADNGDCQQSPDEGLSVLRGTDIHFADLLRAFPREAFGERHDGGLGVLCKFLDSAIRLPIQCHPDRAFASAHFNSLYGKTESWLILATREIRGEKPYLLLGFKPGVTREQFSRAVLSQDVAAMTACLHRFEASPGETYFIPGRIPHAIGPGLMLLEVQEPTDLVVQPERHVGDTILSDHQMWGALAPETALDCFDYQGMPAEEILSKLKLTPKLTRQWENAQLESVISPAHTDCFRVDKLTVTGQFRMECVWPWHLGIVTSGSGTVAGAASLPLRRGDNFFVSNQIKTLEYVPSPGTQLGIHLVSAG